MKTELFIGIAWRIIILFMVGMMMTSVPELLRDFFGDTLLPVDQRRSAGPDADWDWGPGHYWYFWMCFSLFVLAATNAVLSIIGLIEKHLKEDDK